MPVHTPLRAFIFSEPGDPSLAVTARTFSPLPAPGPDEVQLRIRLAAINPSDINVLQGVYPAKPRPRTDLGTTKPVFIPGNEGLGEVIALGPAVSSKQGNPRWKLGDRVVMGIPQSGTWSNTMNVKSDCIISVNEGTSDPQAATMSINPPTALLMLRRFVDLKEGDFVIQNGANSAVGQSVIQIARARGLKTINLVRDRPDITDLKRCLQALGGDYVLTYDDINERSVKDRMREWTGSKPILLGLNCVSGKDTTAMTKLLSPNAHLVSYGAMSKAPLSLPTSLFIFKNLTAHGFMTSSYFAEHPDGIEERRRILGEIGNLLARGELKEPTHEIVTFSSSQSDDEVTERFRNLLERIQAGSYGKKALIRFHD